MSTAETKLRATLAGILPERIANFAHHAQGAIVGTLKIEGGDASRLLTFKAQAATCPDLLIARSGDQVEIGYVSGEEPELDVRSFTVLLKEGNLLSLESGRRLQPTGTILRIRHGVIEVGAQRREVCRIAAAVQHQGQRHTVCFTADAGESATGGHDGDELVLDMRGMGTNRPVVVDRALMRAHLFMRT